MTEETKSFSSTTTGKSNTGIPIPTFESPSSEIYTGSEIESGDRILIDVEEEVDYHKIFNYSLPNNHNRQSSNGNGNSKSSNGNRNRVDSSPTSLIPNLVSNNGILPLPFSFLNSSSLAFTFQSIDEIKHYLSSLQDEHSTFMEVAKACHFLNQFGTHGSYNSTPNSSSSSSYPSIITSMVTVLQSNILKIEQYTSDISQILNILSNTATNHLDRRCRIIAIQSLATIANSTLTKLITTPTLYSNRTDSIYISRIQDEICNDVILTIVNCILNDDDDGVSSIAMETLSHFIHSDCVNIPNKNVITKEIFDLKCQFMTKNNHLIPKRSMWDGESGDYGCGGYADTVQDVDNMSHKADLTWRILEYVLGPRVRKIFVRICLYKQREHRIRCLDVMNDIMIFVYKTERARRGVELGKEGFAKRWYEFDSSILMQEYIDIFLVPMLHVSNIGEMQHLCDNEEAEIGVVVNALMICHVVKCKDICFDQLIRLSVQSLESKLLRSKQSGQRQEMKSNIVALLLIALRGVQRVDRVRLLVLIANVVATMPSIQSVPKDVISPALQFEDGKRLMPSRIGFWSEIAFAILLPDGLSTNNNSAIKADASKRKGDKQSSWFVLNQFFESDSMKKILKSRASMETKGVINPVDEMVYVFCSVAYSIGNRMLPILESTESAKIANSDDSSRDVNSQSSGPDHIEEWYWILSDYESWFRSSIQLLKSFLLCFTWNCSKETTTSSSNASMKAKNRVQDELGIVSTFCFACQRAYLELLKVVVSSKLNINSSVFLHFCCSIPSISSNLKLSNGGSSLESNLVTENELTQVLDDIMKALNQPENVLHRKLRISFLALLCDIWVQKCTMIIQANVGLYLDKSESTGGPVDVDEDVANINEQRARELLALLGSEISKLLDEEKGRCSTTDTVLAGEAQRSLTVCIVAVETIGYTAQRLVNHFSDSNTNKEIEESARYIASVCIVVLRGQGKVELDNEELDNEELDNEEDVKITSSEIESQHKLSTSDSPPGSPRSRARVTMLTNECANSAKRLQEFMSHHNDFSDKNHQCPLFQESGYGVDQDDMVNDLWILSDRFSLVDITFNSNVVHPRILPTQISEEALFYFPQIFRNGNRESGYLMQLCRQLLCHLVEQAIESCPLHFLNDTYHNSAHTLTKILPQTKLDSLRLGAPALPLEQIPAGLNFNEGKIMFSNNTSAISSGSDPLAITASFSVRQFPRFDGNYEWGLVVSVAIHNKTPVAIENGIKMDATIISPTDSNTTAWNRLLLTESAVSKDELEPGGHFIWEFVLNSFPFGGKLCITSTLREISSEISAYKTIFNGNNEANLYDYDNIDGGDDEIDEIADIVIHGEPLSMPSMIILQPSPLVFYRNRLGDQNSFLFLWFSMPHILTDINITPNHNNSTGNVGSNRASRVLASNAMMKVLCDERNGRKIVTAWAFSTWCGRQILVTASSDISKTNVDETGISLVVKGDDKDFLRYIVGSQKEIFVSDLTEGIFSVS